jgi:tryptophan synthase beta chain
MTAGAERGAVPNGKSVVAQIAERRLADVRAGLGRATYADLAARADAFTLTPGGAPRPIAERLAAPGLHLIAEVKRNSPSAGAIVADADPIAQARAYEAGGASAVSVLCEPHWFGGSVADLRAVRSGVGLPVLAKEFVVDERQLPVVRAAGADVVLLLASVLPAADLARFVDLAFALGLEPLVEAHDEAELEAALASRARLIGLNNRNLRTLVVDPDNCVRLRSLVPDDRLVVGESGVKEPRTLVGWRAVGIDAALVGETLMRSADPAAAARAMVAAGSMPRDIAAADRRPLVKICGVTDVEGTLAAVRSGADAIGLNFVQGSSRRLSLEEGAVLARLVRESARPGSMPLVVAVVADMPAADLDAMIAAVAPDSVQLCGSEPASAISAMVRPAWKVLHLPAAGAAAGSATGAAEVAARTIARGREYLAAGAARLLLDTAGGPLPGGTGKQVARDIAAAVAREIPVILAGGLDVSNVAGALLAVPAVGVDVASGVEAPRSRGAGKVRAAEAGAGAATGATVADGAHAPAARPRKDPLKVALFVKRANAARFDRPSAPSRPTPVHESLLDPDGHGRWGLGREFGGRYVPETLIAALEELEDAWLTTRHDPRFWAELREFRYHYGGRPTSIYRADRLGAEALAAARELAGDSAAELPEMIRLYLKREDLNHTGAHKLNNALGQVLLALRLGKRRIVAETGAGMHGVATATACALLEVPCVVYMGIEDIARQAPNVLRMEALGAEVRPVHGGSGTLKDAVSEALRDWVTTVETTHYCLGSTMGPHPYPMLVRDFQRVIGDEAAAQLLEIEGRLPDLAIACVGGGSNALGLLQRFVGEPSVRLAVAEAAGEGLSSGRHAAALLGGTPGILHGSRSYMLQDSDGQVVEAVSISAGLDYPGIGPQLSALMQAGRLTVTAATDAQAIAAVRQVARTEGILAAVESAHAVAALPGVIARLAASRGSSGRATAEADAISEADATAQGGATAEAVVTAQGGPPTPLPREAVIVLGLSGRGDKDLAALGLREVER